MIAFNVSVPTEPPSLGGWKPRNPCWVVLLVLKMTDAAREAAQQPVDAWPPGLKLWKRWIDEAPGDPYLAAQLKGIFEVRPLEGNSLPRIVEKWSGKPVLMAAAGGFGRRQGLSKFTKGAGFREIRVDVGESFSYLAAARRSPVARRNPISASADYPRRKRPPRNVRVAAAGKTSAEYPRRGRRRPPRHITSWPRRASTKYTTSEDLRGISASRPRDDLRGISTPRPRRRRDPRRKPP